MTSRMNEPWIDSNQIRNAVDRALADAGRLRMASGEEILAHAEAWSIRQDGVHSIEDMDDEELRQSVVEELVVMQGWIDDGKVMSIDASTLARHVPDRMKSRVAEALADPFVQSLLLIGEDGSLSIHPDHLADAMDFCGVLLEGHEPLEGRTFISAGPAVVQGAGSMMRDNLPYYVVAHGDVWRTTRSKFDDAGGKLPSGAEHVCDGGEMLSIAFHEGLAMVVRYGSSDTVEAWSHERISQLRNAGMNEMVESLTILSFGVDEETVAELNACVRNHGRVDGLAERLEKLAERRPDLVARPFHPR